MPIPEGFQNYAAALGFPKSETLGRIFELLYDEKDDAIVTGAMPGTVQEITEKCELPETRVQEIIDKLFSRGAISRTLKRADYFKLFPIMVELRDSNVIYWKDAPDELFQLWEDLLNNEMAPLMEGMKEMEIPAGMRVIPVEETIDEKNKIMDVDSVKKIFMDAEVVSAVPCPCRMLVEKTGGGKDCKAPASAVCMQTNGFARPILDRNAGEQLTNEEAVKRIEEAAQAGLVHVVRNNVKEDMFMCNCCSCCCVGFRFMDNYDLKGIYAPSRFKAVVDTDNCTACGTCEDMCKFNAITVDDEASINDENCYGCGLCVANCPDDAMSMEEVRPEEHVRST
ncbi:MAG: 4Fe-4S binding protein [Desulfobacterales bacterium]|jgi:ferredoxin|nr:4Fe-4S binding protein [Desulfobacteraceae bacterium]MBT4363511.1 4Fe-4S binding protein [Desulfobacteraceae bacterium]MBT7086017.1 4Fe-4S binding protein [Desulfobacterales bacterium]MBT7696643.1 4Fe-4S binding protein [Desulfobacterales bacterium]